MPVKYSTNFLVQCYKLILKFIWEHKEPKIEKIILKFINKMDGLVLLDIKTYCRATVIIVLVLR